MAKKPTQKPKESARKISLFKNSYAEEPEEQLTIDEFVERIKSGHWKKIVERLREIKDLKFYKKTKESLPAVTVSGEFKTRDKFIPIGQRIKQHSEYLALDIDKKDNPKIRTKDLIDRDCLMQYVSCSGEGIKIIYRCSSTKDAAEHRRIYDAAVERLAKKGIKLKVDPIVKNIASLQYVSYDPNAFYFPKSKLVIHPLPPVKHKKTKPSEDQEKDIAQMSEFIEALDGKDITTSYEDWLTIAMGLTYSLGEAGRSLFHLLSKNYPDYNEGETNEKYDGLLERDPANIDRPVTLASVYQIINGGIPKVKLRHLMKKYNQSHAVGVGEDTEQGDLLGMVSYRLFNFKKVTDKESNILVELVPHEINWNAFEDLLKEKGFYRHDELFVQIKDNIVEQVDDHDILRLVTRHIEESGDHTFTYQKQEFTFSWEELALFWRKIRAQGTTFNQIATCLEHWVPNLLKDSNGVSFIPYQNGVLRITKDERTLVEYKDMAFQIWKERILPRNFRYNKEPGMFEDFFNNVCGKSKIKGEKQTPDRYKRAMWYFGYMLHGFKMKSLARAWMIYDIRPGNNGRTGKSILGQAIGQIRSVTIIDGKQVDFRDNRFALQKVTPWTEIVFIDDPKRTMSLAPLFNMITGDTDAEAKGENQLTLSLKYMIASNWILELDGTSEQGRQFITQISDFYLRYKDGTPLQPLVDLHGKEFFTGWDEEDWRCFDSFCVRCLQQYMGSAAPDNTIIGNARQIRFLQQQETELFFELSTIFNTYVKLNPKGKPMIPQSLLIEAIKKSVDFSPSSTKCGKIAREFLLCINGGKVSVSSTRVSGLIQMTYEIDSPYSALDFGDIGDQLPKPKF